MEHATLYRGRQRQRVLVGLTPEQVKQLDALADEQGGTRSHLIRESVRIYLLQRQLSTGQKEGA